MEKPIEQIFANLIREFMELDEDQVVVRDQNFKIPNDRRVYIAIGMIDSRPYSGASYMETRLDVDDVPYQVEVTRTNIGENIQIDIMSRSNEAIFQKNDVYLALNSFASKQAQEKYEFKISRIPVNMLNTSAAEGGSNINRFTMVVPCMTWYVRENGMPVYDYYDNFRTRVDDEKTIGQTDPLFEFEITPDTPDPAQLP